MPLISSATEFCLVVPTVDQYPTVHLSSTHSGDVFLGAIGTVRVKHLTQEYNMIMPVIQRKKLRLKQAAAYIRHKLTNKWYILTHSRL